MGPKIYVYGIVNKFFLHNTVYIMVKGCIGGLERLYHIECFGSYKSSLCSPVGSFLFRDGRVYSGCLCSDRLSYVYVSSEDLGFVSKKWFLWCSCLDGFRYVSVTSVDEFTKIVASWNRVVYKKLNLDRLVKADYIGLLIESSSPVDITVFRISNVVDRVNSMCRELIGRECIRGLDTVFYKVLCRRVSEKYRYYVLYSIEGNVVELVRLLFYIKSLILPRMGCLYSKIIWKK